MNNITLLPLIIMPDVSNPITLQDHLTNNVKYRSFLNNRAESVDPNNDSNRIFYIVQNNITNPFSACNGLLIRDSDGFILIDANILPQNLDSFLSRLHMKVKAHFITHSHLDHSTHLHLLQKAAKCTFYCPDVEDRMVSSIRDHLKFTGFSAAGLDSQWKIFAHVLGFEPLNRDLIHSFDEHHAFQFDFGTIQSIPLNSHSHNHVGFLISMKEPKFNVLYVSDIGIDYNDQYKGFGPWYGFHYTYLSNYFADIDFLIKYPKNAYDVIVSSHGPMIIDKSDYPFDYIRTKIEKNHQKVMDIVRDYLSEKKTDLVNVKDLIEFRDTIYKLNGIKEPLLALYKHWQFEFTKHHLILAEDRGTCIRIGRDEFRVKIEKF